MATPRKIGGYVDRQELARAQRANKDARRMAKRILRETDARRGSGWLYPFLARLAQELAVVSEALMEMERIRVQQEE